MLAGILVVLGVLIGAGLFMLGAAANTGAGAIAAGAGGLLVVISIWTGVLGSRDDHEPAH